MSEEQSLELTDSQTSIPSFEDDEEDDEVEPRRLATWNGDPEIDVLSATDWIQSIQVSISSTF
jgi:hypothetical protein